MAISASRGGVRMPFPTRSTTRNPTTCHAALATAMGAYGAPGKIAGAHPVAECACEPGDRAAQLTGGGYLRLERTLPRADLVALGGKGRIGNIRRELDEVDAAEFIIQNTTGYRGVDAVIDGAFAGPCRVQWVRQLIL